MIWVHNEREYRPLEVGTLEPPKYENYLVYLISVRQFLRPTL